MNHSLALPVNAQSNQRVYTGQRDAAVDALHCRMAAMQPGSVDAERHSIEAILVTETAVPMFDHYEGRMFDEVLLAEGGSWRTHLPLLDSHYRWSSRATLGSIHNVRQANNAWHGRLEFVRGDEEVDKIWLRVEQGHLRGVSAGYSYVGQDVVRIAPGQTQLVRGRNFTAGEREMRIVTKWRGHEASTTPVQADENSHTRSDGGKNRPVAYQVETEGIEQHVPSDGQSLQNNGARQVPPELLAYLRSLGLTPAATAQEAQEFHRNLSGEHRREADAILQRAQQPNQSTTTTGASASGQAQAATTQTVQAAARQAEPAPQAQAQTAAPATVPMNERQAGAAEERERIETIRFMGNGVDPHVVDRAITEGWTIQQARTQFAALFFDRSAPAQTGNAEHVRSQTQEPTAMRTGTPGNPGQAPAAHFQTSENPSLRTLQAALLNRTSQHLLTNHNDGAFLALPDVRVALQRSQGDWLGQWNRAMAAGGQVGSDLQDAARAVDNAWQYRDFSVMDYCRHCLRLEGLPVPGNNRDLFQRAIATASAQALFTTNFQVSMLSGFMLVADTTQGWVFEDDVANWQKKEYVQKGLTSRLRRKARTAAPDQATFEATKEELQVFTYAERFDMTREDAFDDRLGGLGMTPAEMGEAAGEVRPDLVYALLLSNPNLSNGNPAFQTAGADIDNLTTGVTISEASLSAMETKMGTQISNGRPIASIPEYLITARSKMRPVKRLLGSDEDRNTTANTQQGTANAMKNAFIPVHEPRLDTGFINPLNDTPVAAAPGTIFLSEAGRKGKGMACVYLRADGRNPVTDQYTLTEGRIGMGWSINMVIGAGFIGRHGIAKGTP